MPWCNIDTLREKNDSARSNCFLEYFPYIIIPVITKCHASRELTVWLLAYIRKSTMMMLCLLLLLLQPSTLLPDRSLLNLKSREMAKRLRKILINTHRYSLLTNPASYCYVLGDIADKRFRLLRSTLPFRGLPVCLSVCLSVKFVHCAKTAEDIDTISFAYNSPMILLDGVNTWFTSVNPLVPKPCPKVSTPVHTYVGDIR